MASYADRVVRQSAAEEIRSIAKWRREFTRQFTKPDIVQLEKLTAAADRLWENHIKELRRIRKETRDSIRVFGRGTDGIEQKTSTDRKDRIKSSELLSHNVRNSSAYRRLKLVMDYWCALWFWPIEKAEQIPTREEFLLDLSLILEGNVYESVSEINEQFDLFPDTRPKQLSLEILDDFGFVNVNELCKKVERLGLVCELAEKYRFLHWELEFADLFADNGGFDLVLGNPPWIKSGMEGRGRAGRRRTAFRAYGNSALQK